MRRRRRQVLRRRNKVGKSATSDSFSTRNPGSNWQITPRSVEQLEQQIQQLPPGDLVRLAEWLNRLPASRTPADAAAELEWEETPELVAELERRLAEFRANPAIAVPFEPDYFENLKRQFLDERRLMREAEYCRKHPPGHAQCGINWYPAGSGWSHFHKCGQALIYTTDPETPRRECPGRRP